MNIIDIINSFEIESSVLEYRLFGNGHINTTYHVHLENGKNYVLQKINNTVFKDTDMLMNNVYLVTEYLRRNGFESLHAVKTKDGQLYLKDGNDCYRLYDFIEDSVCYEKVDNMFLVYSDGKAFGKLHRALAGFDASKLGEVIPNFHNTPKRYQNLLDAIKEDKMSRVQTCLPEIEIAKKYSKEYSKIVDGIKSGEISNAVTHNDPKINNVLFDKYSGDIRSVIDLDTIMPGSYLYDFGDSLRSLFTGNNEDSTDLSQLVVNYEIFEAYTKGYYSEMKDVLTPKELELLPFSAFLLTMECAMRFLEDYIRGDVYFKTQYPKHNLIRARTQLTLAENIYKSFDKLTAIVNKVRKNVERMIAIGVDIGGTSIKGGAINEKGQIFDYFSMDVIHDEPAEVTVQKIIDMINGFIAKNNYKKEEIIGIGCGIPGVIDSTNGVVTFSNNLKWHNLPFKKMLEDGTGLPVRITNDANAAALAEAKFGVGKKYKSFLMLTLGTGIGSGIVIDGKLYEGHLGKGGEFGHSLLVMDGRKCTCGRRGCLEAYASATALTKDTERMMRLHKDSKMWELYHKYGTLKAVIPFDAAKAGDEYGIEIIDNYVKYLSEGLMNYFNTFRPEAVILSGGIAEEGEFLISKIRHYCQERHYGLKMAPAVDIIKSKVGYDSGKIGAAALMFK